MFNVYVGENYVISYDKSKETTFQVVCSSHNVPYLKKDEENYILFPSLRGVNLLVTNLSKEDQKIDELVQNLINQLLSRGAQVLSGVSNKSFSTFANIMNAQMLLGFYSKDCSNDSEYLRIFYSLKNKTKSLSLVSAIANNLQKQQQPLPYKIANIFEVLGNLKYLKVYLCEVPTVLLEINTSILEKYDIESVVINGLIDIFQNRPEENELLSLCDIMKYLETEETCTYEKDSENQEEEVNNIEIISVESLQESEEESGIKEVKVTEEDKAPDLLADCTKEEIDNKPQQLKTASISKKKKALDNKKQDNKLANKQKPRRNYLSWIPPFEENIYQFRAHSYEEDNAFIPMQPKKEPKSKPVNYQPYQKEKSRERIYPVYKEPVNLLDELKTLGTLVEQNDEKNNMYV